MPVQYKRNFEPLTDKNLFLQLEEEETSEFERHLRFVYAVNNVLRHIRNNYHPFEGDFPKMDIPPMRRDYNIWYPKSGSPAVLSTEIVSGPINIVYQRVFKKDPLYKEFELALRNPPSNLTLTLTSTGNGQEEFSKLTRIFENSCSDINWQAQMPKFLRTSARL